MDVYYTDASGGVVGPLTAAATIDALKTKRISYATQVCLDGQNWMTAGSALATLQKAVADESKSKPVARKPKVKVASSKSSGKSKLPMVPAVLVALLLIGGSVAGFVVYQKKQQAQAAASAAEKKKQIVEWLVSTKLVADAMFVSCALVEKMQNELDAAFDRDGLGSFRVILNNYSEGGGFKTANDQVVMISNFVGQLSNPPDGCADAYATLRQMNNAYQTYVRQVTSPDGTILIWREAVTKARTELVNTYSVLPGVLTAAGRKAGLQDSETEAGLKSGKGLDSINTEKL